MGLRDFVRRTTFLQRSVVHLRTVRMRRRHPLGVIPDAPQRVIIEPTNACNLACAYCGNSRMVRPWRYLDMDLYRRMIGEMVELSIPHLTLHTIGEPTMHPNIVEMIRIAKAAGRFVNISTNGTLLTEEFAHELVLAGPDVLNVSADSANPEHLAQSRGGLELDRLLAGLRRLRRHRDAEGPLGDTAWGRLRLPTLVVTCVITPLFGRAEERRFFDTFGPLVDDVYFHWPNNHADYAHDEPFRWKSLVPRRLQDWAYKKVRTPCTYPWNSLFLLSDGTMSVCRFDFDGRVSVGRYGPQGLLELWRSQRMDSLRRAHMTFDFSDWSTCESCTATYYENRHEHWVQATRLKERNGWVAGRDAWRPPAAPNIKDRSRKSPVG